MQIIDLNNNFFCVVLTLLMILLDSIFDSIFNPQAFLAFGSSLPVVAHPGTWTSSPVRGFAGPLIAALGEALFMLFVIMMVVDPPRPCYSLLLCRTSFTVHNLHSSLCNVFKTGETEYIQLRVVLLIT